MVQGNPIAITIPSPRRSDARLNVGRIVVQITPASNQHLACPLSIQSAVSCHSCSVSSRAVETVRRRVLPTPIGSFVLLVVNTDLMLLDCAFRNNMTRVASVDSVKHVRSVDTVETGWLPRGTSRSRQYGNHSQDRDHRLTNPNGTVQADHKSAIPFVSINGGLSIARFLQKSLVSRHRRIVSS